MYIQMIIEREIQTLEDSWIRLEYFFRHLSICLSLSKSYKFLTDFLCNWCNKKELYFMGRRTSCLIVVACQVNVLSK